MLILDVISCRCPAHSNLGSLSIDKINSTLSKDNIFEVRKRFC